MFFILMFTSLLDKTQHSHIIWKIETSFLFDALFCYLVEWPIHAFSVAYKRNTAYLNSHPLF